MSSIDHSHDLDLEPEHQPDPRPTPADEVAEPLEVEVRRNAALAALVGAGASALAIAYVARALSSGSVLDWVLTAVLGVIGVSQLVSLVDSRTPLLVADSFGIRLRLGREWRGLPWDSLEQVVVEPRTSLIHDGRLVVAPRHLNRALEGLDAKARRQVALSQRLYGAPLVVPLGMTTRVSTHEVVAELAELANGRSAVVELAGYVAQPVLPDSPGTLDRREAAKRLAAQRQSPAGDEHVTHDTAPGGGSLVEGHDPRAGRLRGGLGTIVSRIGHGRSHDMDADTPSELPVPVAAEVAPTFAPAPLLRDARPASRVDVQVDLPRYGSAAPRLDTDDHDHTGGRLPEHEELRRRDEMWEAQGVVPIARPGHAVAPLVIDDFATEPALVPVIGPRIEQARTRLGFGIETLSDRTRIRPHVLEAIEVDDFEPCGGDFYARGHLRTLATVLGLPTDELLAEFDERYASAPINARRVFEAELATGMSGGIKATNGGPRWGLMMGVVLVLVLVWGIARLFTDTPQHVTSQSPVLNGSAGLASHQQPITSSLGTPVPMTVKAVRGPSDVLVRDHSGRILWAGHLNKGGHQQLFGTGPFTVRAGKPAAVDVWVAGKARGAVGTGDQTLRRTFR